MHVHSLSLSHTHTRTLSLSPSVVNVLVRRVSDCGDCLVCVVPANSIRRPLCLASCLARSLSPSSSPGPSSASAPPRSCPSRTRGLYSWKLFTHLGAVTHTTETWVFLIAMHFWKAYLVCSEQGMVFEMQCGNFINLYPTVCRNLYFKSLFKKDVIFAYYLFSSTNVQSWQFYPAPIHGQNLHPCLKDEIGH